ncbi:MAG: RiPP maturation radical SAM C-methyltransferase, partial [Thermoanaerobaculia bacterium]|nr:RiPP maturation radical SAM C-methyltransferase [Thermoanaerobaculia bacterium]
GRENAYRKRTPGRVLAELDELSRRYSLATFETVDNILPMSALEDLLPALVAAGRPYDLFFETKANLTRDQVRLLAEAGVRWTQPGIESLGTELLRLLGKGCEAWQNVQLLKWSRQFGIRLSWNLLSEVPGDRDEWYGAMAEFVPLLEHLQPPSGVAPIQFHRYSSYHRDPARFGLRLRPAPGYSAVYPLPEEELADLVYLFEDGWRDTVRKSPVLKMLLDGPGLPRLRQRFLAWAGRWVEGPVPDLVATHAEGAMHVRDTRSVAPQAERTVTGLDRLVLRETDRAPLEKGLFARLAGEGHEAEVVAESVERLLEQKLVLRIDGRLVGLVLEEPVAPLPALEAGPFGRELPRERPVET